MSLLEEVIAQKRSRGAECTVAVIYRENPDKRTELAEVIDSTHEATVVSAVLKGNGYDIRPEPIRRHRNRVFGRGCQCP